MSEGCKYPGCTWVGESRPYARKRDMPSVTAISGAYDDGKARSFGWAASLIAATTAIHEPEKWADLGTEGCTHDIHVDPGLCPACKFVRSEFDRQWNAKATLGNHLHHGALSWTQSEEFDEDDTTEPYMNALAGFFTDHSPEWIEVERTVLYDNPKSQAYRGQFDWIATIECPVCSVGTRCKWLGDWKSGNYYPASQTLQLSAYRHAQHMTIWEGKVEKIDKPVPVVRHAGVVLLGGDGNYQLVELPANGDAFGTFQRMRDAYTWHQQMKRWDREHPLPLHTSTAEEPEVAA